MSENASDVLLKLSIVYYIEEKTKQKLYYHSVEYGRKLGAGWKMTSGRRVRIP